MPNPFETDWSNIDLEREGCLSLIDGMTFDDFLTEINSYSFRDNKEAVSRHFEKRLREITSEARDIFEMNLVNIITYANRDAIAEALEAERDAKDWEAMRQIGQDFYTNNRAWFPISQKKFDYMLESLPPLRMGRGGFMHSEPVDSLDSGEEVYFVALKWDGQCYATYGTAPEWDDKHLFPREEIPRY